MKQRLNQISTSKISKVISEVREIWEELNQEYIDNCIEYCQADYKNVWTMKVTG